MNQGARSAGPPMTTNVLDRLVRLDLGHADLGEVQLTTIDVPASRLAAPAHQAEANGMTVESTAAGSATSSCSARWSARACTTSADCCTRSSTTTRRRPG